MGIMGTPVVYTEYEDGIAFFYVKSYIEYARDPNVEGIGRELMIM
jgi:hypothetical protein